MRLVTHGLFASSLRAAPAAVQVEYSLLGAIFTNNRAFDRVADFLRPQHFSEPVHGRIFTECARRILAGNVVNPITLQAWFEADRDGGALGGVAYLGQLLASTVGIINAREYGAVIVECWQRRELIAASEEMHAGSFGNESTPAEIAAAMIDRLDAVLGDGGGERKAVTFDSAAAASMAAMERAMQGAGVPGVSTGMASVDEALGGLEDATLTVLAGRPGMGKSALGAQWAVNVARAARDAKLRGEKARGALIVSLEMSADQIARRTLAAAARVPVEAIRRGCLSQADVDRLVAAQKELAGLPLSIEDCSGLSIGTIRLKARAAQRRHGIGLLVLDHLHIVRPEPVDLRNGSTAAIERISNGMKQLAKELACPVVALAQLNRGVESREDKRPTLMDLRQSGALEQDADAVAFVYRGEYYLPNGEPEQGPGESAKQFADRCLKLDDDRVRLKGRAELILAKMRDGLPQTVPLRWDGSTTSFSEA